MIFIAGLCVTTVANAQQYSNEVEGLRLWHSPNNTRIVFDVSADLKYRVFGLDNPLRLVVDLESTRRTEQLPELDANNPHIAKIRTGRPGDDQLRYVFELKQPLESRDFVLSPNELYGHRLVIDLDEAVSSDDNDELEPKLPVNVPPISTQNTVLGPESVQPPKPFLIAVDAGHGGEDPGALGHRGTREKHITLDIAKKLVASLNRNPGMRAFLVREGDYFIKLHERREIARAKNADMFISIHADAFTKRSARGLSVFALSQSGATSAMASALAAKENASDLIGGVSLADKDEVLAKVLVDLSMTNTISESVNFGGRLLKELGAIGRLHSKRVEQAGFAVLKSPDIPSVLIETGFITNPEEEQRLRSADYQQRLAEAINRAVRSYVEQTPFVTQSRYAAATQAGGAEVYQSLVKPPRPSTHKVRSGESLSTIAARYGTSVSKLKQANNLRSDRVLIGQRLKLPSSGSSNSSSTASSSARPSSHVVKRGESLSLISARYNVPIRSIKALNNLSSDTVFVGQRLSLPGGQSNEPRKPTRHVVRRGDTLSEIAETYNTTMSSIMRANSMRTRTVQLGQTLTIP